MTKPAGQRTNACGDLRPIARITATGTATAMARNVTSSVTGMPPRKNGRKSPRGLASVIRFQRVGQHCGPMRARSALKRARCFRRGCQELVVDVEAETRYHLR